MKFGSIRLIGYIGIYNGLALDEIYINFRKCKNKIVLIKGLNGSGKSTLLYALSPLPDSNDNFIPEREARKELEIINGDITYKITFIHGIKTNKERETTKAYITKYVNGVGLELNPNGNVGSYKDVLFGEFNLDPNFISLTQLGCEDRGLVDKKPADRKRFVNMIVNTLEAYNAIHKTLNKRSTTFRSMMNRLISKIDSLGKESQLIISLKNVEKTISDSMNRKDHLLEELSSFKSTIKILDPDGSIQTSYDYIYNSIMNINASLNTLDNKFKNLCSSIKLNENISITEITTLYSNIQSEINDIGNSVVILENEIQFLLNDREQEAKQIQIKTQKLESLQDSINHKELLNAIRMYESRITNYENILTMIGISKGTLLTKNEYIVGLNTLKEIHETIMVMKSNANYSIIDKAINDFILKDMIPNISNVLTLLGNKNIELRQIELDIQHYNSLLNIVKILELRPNECNITSCGFITDALSALEQSPKEKVEQLNERYKTLLQDITQLEKEKVELTEINEYCMYITRIIRSIKSNSPILSKLPNTDNILNIKILLTRISKNDTFEEISNLYKYIEYCDIFEEYTNDKENLVNLKNTYKLYESKSELINSIISDLTNLEGKLSTLTSKIEDSRQLILDNRVNLQSLEYLRDKYKDLLELLDTKTNLESNKATLMSQFYTIKNSMEKIKDCADKIINTERELDSISKSLSPLIENRDEIKHNLKVLKEYQEELDLYVAKNEKIQTIKYYCAPSTGIQLLYIELYMNKTLMMANELLSMIFDGNFIIQPYVINEDEFRIPCIGDGLPRDDISSLSTSQKSIISMILSFVLLKQSSTTYNILKLDEIDGGLDEFNRRMFIQLLYKQMAMLDVEQTIMVSHNIEIDTSECDLIVLKTNNEIQNLNGNIIYQY